MSSILRYSIVVPVFNEADNIGLFCKRALAELPPDFELLICYDFDGDSTLPALAAISASEKPALTRLVKNDLGRGVRYAIDAGMRAARAPIVVVMMADLSDDFAKVEALVGKAEAGADVVCASRYMRGGKQIGGPRLKGLMSRTAGLTLHWFAGLPTHDPTNSFKAYRKSFLDRTQIESPAGFCLGLELTAKAHFRGGRVDEVPATWHDRSAGESRFQLRKWLPLYLRWYFWAFDQRFRSVLRTAYYGALGILVFLTIAFPATGMDARGLDQSWSHALSHAYLQQWRAGVDYVFTYGPLGFLTTWAFHPSLFGARMAWELLVSATMSLLALRALSRVNSRTVHIAFALGLTVFSPAARNVLTQDAKYVFLATAVTYNLLASARPNRGWTVAGLAMLATLSLTKFSFFLLSLPLALAVLAHYGLTRGWRSALAMSGFALAFLTLLWTVAAHQSLGDFPTFVRMGLVVADGYGPGMCLGGPKSEVIAGAMAAGLLMIAALIHAPAEMRWPTRLLLIASIGWATFVLFKGAFTRQEQHRLATYFWTISVIGLLVWPTIGRAGATLTAGRIISTALLALGFYGFVSIGNDRWSAPIQWARTVRRNASFVTRPLNRYATLCRGWQQGRDEAALPGVVDIVGDRSIDMLTLEPGWLIANGLNWTPRPVFQSYATHAQELQRLNRDFFQSSAAPDFVLFRGETFDNRLPTQDDGPAVLELLRRYEPRHTERGYLLLERRAEPRPELLGATLLDRDIQFGETVDLAALGPGPKAISFQIEDSRFGLLRKCFYRPAGMAIEVKFASGGNRSFRLAPNMVRDPILIDPLPLSPEDYAALFSGRLPTSVAEVKLVIEHPGIQRYFADRIRCTVRSVHGLSEDPTGAAND